MKETTIKKNSRGPEKMILPVDIAAEAHLPGLKGKNTIDVFFMASS